MEQLSLVVTAEQAGRRLDHVLAEARPERSRSEAQRDIRSGNVRVGCRIVRQASCRVRCGETIDWQIPAKPVLAPRPIPLTILFEDEDLVVIDKPVGLVVHPGSGTSAPTLVEALLVDRDLPPSDDPARPGIVHRLDRETSGLIVVAKTPPALSSLQHQFAARSVRKTYLAIAEGSIPEDEGWIDAPVGRDPRLPSRMSVHPRGRPSQTAFSVVRRDGDVSLLAVHPRTGRTHQIRVHLRYIDHPVVGDALYGGRPATRLMLHAWRLAFTHPTTGASMKLQSDVPKGFPVHPYDEVAWWETAART